MTCGIMKLSGSHVTTTMELNCIPEKFVTTFTPYLLKVFSINPINRATYPEELAGQPGDILYELHHTFLTTNDLTWDPPFRQYDSLKGYDEYWYLTLSDFFEYSKSEVGVNGISVVEDKSSPSTWVKSASTALSGSVLIIKSNTTSTIVKLNSAPASIENIELGYMRNYGPYEMKPLFSLSCTPEPDPIVPNLTLNLSTLEIPWVAGEEYTIEVNDGVVNHQYGEKYSNPSFSVPFTANENPDMLSWSPLNNPLSGNIHYALIKYPRKICSSIGNIKLYKNISTLISTFPPGDSRVEFIATDPLDKSYPNSHTVKIDVRGLLEPNQDYHITFESSVATDLDKFPTVAITDPSRITFTAAMPNYIDWEPGNVTATDNNRSVKIIYPYVATPLEGSLGTIRFYDSDDNLLRTFNPNSPDVSYYPTVPSVTGYPNSTTVELDVLGLLKENSTYYTLIDQQVFDDVDGFGNPPVTDTMELRYSTDDSIGNGLFPGLKSDITAVSLVTYNGVRVRLNRSDFYSTTSASATGEIVKTTKANLQSSTTISASGNLVTKLVDFTVKSYIANNVNNFTSVFGPVYPRLSTDDTTSIFTLKLQSNYGKFGTSTGPITGYELTGTRDQINTELFNVCFWPNKNHLLGINIVFILYQGTTQINPIISKTIYRTATNVFSNYYTFTDSTAWIPTPGEKYYALMDVLAVGAGGGGGGVNTRNANSENSAGGGGGAGAVLSATNQAIDDALTITIGQGGSGATTSRLTGGTGGTTVVYKENLGITLLSATGGSGGQTRWNTGIPSIGIYAGTSAAGYSGGNGWVSDGGYPYYTAGGGGGGSLSNGNSAIYTQQIHYGGTGGGPTYSSISGSVVSYASGGYGSSNSENAPMPTLPLVEYGDGGHAGTLSNSGHVAYSASSGGNGVVIIHVYS